MMALAPLVNRLWLASGARARARFHWALAHPAQAQAARLRAILADNHATVYGRCHAFAQIGSPGEYQRRVPLTAYDDVAPFVARMAAGEANVLTRAPLKLFEPSSGSTAAAKLIPYTSALQREFQAAIAAWIGNLYQHMPTLRDGPAYWSVTPLVRGRTHTPGGTPIGFEADSAYLGPFGRLLESALAVPNAVKHVEAMDAFRYVTLRYLLATPELRLISVWNPTYLTLLLDALALWWEPLLADLAGGTLRVPGARLPDALHQKLAQPLRADAARARRLAACDPHDPATLARIWPRLDLVSCWADGPAARFAAALSARLPNVSLQPKGLLATEAFVSLPWYDASGSDGAVLAVTSHFLEFLDDADTPHLAHELQQGRHYRVVVTTGGGLYRYQLHDQVEVVGRVRATPRVRFTGKTDRVADLFGEKLNEQFVARCLEELWQRWAVTPRFALLAPAEIMGDVAYTLYVEAAGLRDASGLAADLDSCLRANFHYDYCRRLGQLGSPRVREIVDGAATYVAACQQRGMKLGDIKPALLDHDTRWETAFTQSEDA